MSGQRKTRPLQKTRFLCPRHRQELVRNPECAQATWVSLLSSARHKLNQRDWDKAALIYGNVFETAEIIFEQSNCFYDFNRYLESAIEFVYALRHCSYGADFELLIAVVKQKLKDKFYPSQVSLLLKPLTDTAFLPLSEINYPIPKSQPVVAVNTQTIH